MVVAAARQQWRGATQSGDSDANREWRQRHGVATTTRTGTEWRQQHEVATMTRVAGMDMNELFKMQIPLDPRSLVYLLLAAFFLVALILLFIYKLTRNRGILGSCIEHVETAGMEIMAEGLSNAFTNEDGEESFGKAKIIWYCFYNMLLDMCLIGSCFYNLVLFLH
ncbi:hypothetical protein ACSQ67_014183 [Phaseolus vulgaris]